MCGVAGFFTGCPFESDCDNGGKSCRMSFSRKDIFEKWHAKSTVRSAPRRLLDPSAAQLDLFPRKLVPITAHPLFQDKYIDSISPFLALQLHRYLSFTTNLELIVVNENIRQMLLAAGELKMDSKDRIGLHKMYVDEAYHALFCADFTLQLSDITGVRPAFSSKPRFLDILREIVDGDNVSNTKGLIFTCVAETLITHNLLDVALDKTIPSGVSEIMRDHARDEALHHNFFKEIVSRFSRDNTVDFRSFLYLIPKSIFAFIAPDETALRLGLMQVGVSRDDAIQMIHETYPAEEVANYAKYCARDLLDSIQEFSASDLRLQDALGEYQLI